MSEYCPNPDFMLLAIAEAKSARVAGDYAIGAVVVHEGTVIATAGNRVKLDGDPTQHAEMVAIRLACLRMKTRHLAGTVLYTTAEPCPMCAAAAIWARMLGIVSGSTISDMTEFRQRYGNPTWTWRTVDIAARSVLESGDPKLFILDGFLRTECRELFHDSE